MTRIANPITAVAADEHGNIFELEGYVAAGMSGTSLIPLTLRNTIPMPSGGELMFLPDRAPIVYNPQSGLFEEIQDNPYEPGRPIFPVAAFNSPGFVTAYHSAYVERDDAGYLPLFSYGATGWHGRDFRSPLILIDREKRQDLRFMKQADVVAGVNAMREIMPKNRLRKHLEKCALEYGCPAGKNFFLGRYEAPLPTSRICNARCLGCISLQDNSSISCSQERIRFVPSSEEIAQVAMAHITRVRCPVVSFGQGCEGDPMFAAEAIGPAIERIRSKTADGTINMNTNGSRADILQPLFDTGLDSIRISINSFSPQRYHAYFRPRGYRFPDVVNSIAMALNKGKFVSINYLNCPGVTDTPEELEAVVSFLTQYPIHMIQWRNLNFDPVRYREKMEQAAPHGEPIGIATMIRHLRKKFPKLKMGYFNPPKEKWKKQDI